MVHAAELDKHAGIRLAWWDYIQLTWWVSWGKRRGLHPADVVGIT